MQGNIFMKDGYNLEVYDEEFNPNITESVDVDFEIARNAHGYYELVPDLSWVNMTGSSEGID